MAIVTIEHMERMLLWEIKKLREDILRKIEKYSLRQLIAGNPIETNTIHSGDPYEWVREVLTSFSVVSRRTMIGFLFERYAKEVISLRTGRNPMQVRMGMDVNFIVKTVWGHEVYIMLEMKSGASWGNSDSRKQKGTSFTRKKKAAEEKFGMPVISIVGITYGPEEQGIKKSLWGWDWELHAQSLWYTLSGGNERLYSDMISIHRRGAEDFSRKMARTIDSRVGILAPQVIERYLGIKAEPYIPPIRHDSDLRINLAKVYPSDNLPHPKSELRREIDGIFNIDGDSSDPIPKHKGPAGLGESPWRSKDSVLRCRRRR